MAKSKKKFLTKFSGFILPKKKSKRSTNNGNSLQISRYKNGMSDFLRNKSRYIFGAVLVIFFVVLGIFVAQKFKNFFLAGVVNGEYVTRSELTNKLISQYGSQQWDAIITERLLRQEARKRGVSVSTDEKNARIKEFEDQVGGREALESKLTQQGISRQQFTSQVELEVIVEKMFADKGTYSDEDLKKFWEENKSYLSNEATPSATPSDKAKQELKRSKIFEAAQGWITTAKAQAKSEYYLGPSL